MGFRINTNVAAMSSHMNSVNNNRGLDKSLASLSSGLRINTAADDASGLAIANQLKSQANGLGQAIRNANDGINLAQTADGALEEYTNIINTVRTKSIQAASDGQNDSSRAAIQKDIDKLLEEANNIAGSTSFNGQKLLSGGFSDKEFQIGAYSNETISMNISDTRTNKVGLTTRSDLTLDSDQGGTVQLNLKSISSGETIALKEIDIQSNNKTENGVGALAEEINKYSDRTGVKAKAVVETTTTGAISAGSTGSDFAINGINIGAVSVESNDNSNSLVTAINSKTSKSGVTASLEAGKLTLSSNDGRAIKVSGGVDGVMGGSAKSMSTVGHIELVQSGSADFQINGIGAGAVTNKLTTAADVVTAQDSTIASGSTLKADSILKVGSTTGANIIAKADVVTVANSTLKAGSTIKLDSVLKAGTEVGGTTTVKADTTLTQDAFLSSGSTLKSGSVLGKDSIIQQDFTDGTNTFTKGQVLNADFTTTADLTLTSDMTNKFTAGGGAAIKADSTLQSSSVLGADTTAKVDVTVSNDMTLKTGSTIKADSTLIAGSSIGGDTTVKTDANTYLSSNLQAGSTLKSGSVLAASSTIGGETQVAAITATNFTEDMAMKAGSTIGSGTKFAAGTQLNQDMVLGGQNYKAGDILEQDRASAANIVLSEDMVLKGSATATLAANTKIMTNTENSGSVGVSDGEISSLADIDVTTREGAMKAIDTLDAALKNIDSIRSDIGSTQNQLESTVRNISVTQVNVTAAESSIRDVDFAAESANLQKHNILAQSGVYAMSQANSAQQNVMRLLQ